MKVKPLTPAALDARLRGLVNPWPYGSAKEIVSLGPAALERVLDAKEGKVSLYNEVSDDFHDHFDYLDGLTLAVTAFATEDLASVLAALKARQWSDVNIAESGVAGVVDARVVPFLLTAFASKEPTTRASAVRGLGKQRDPRATDALIRALSDRSSNVRSAAADALGDLGDPRGIEAIREIRKRPRAPKKSRKRGNT